MAGWILQRNRRQAPIRQVLSARAPYFRPGFWHNHRYLMLAIIGITGLTYGFFFGLGTTYLLVQLSVPLVIMAIIVILLLPDTGRGYVGTLEWLLFAFLIALLSWPDYLAIAIPGMPWITIQRLTTVPLATVFLLGLSQSAQLRAEVKEILATIPALWKLLAVFTVLALFSIAFSETKTVTANKFAVAMLAWVLIFFVSCYIFTKPGRVVKLAYLVWALAIFVSLIGIQEARHEALPWAAHIPSFLKVDERTLTLILSSKARAATGVYRVQSKFTTPLGLAEFLAFSAPFILHIMMNAKRIWHRLAAASTLPLLIYVILKTDSRLGMVGIFLAILFYALAWGALRWKRDKTSLFGPAVVLGYPIVFVSFILGTFFIGRLRALVWGTGAQQASTDGRKEQLAESIPLIIKQPWGYGLARAAETLGYGDSGDGNLTIDSYYLSMVLDLGFAGFIVYFAIFYLAIWQGGKHVIHHYDEDTSYIVPLVICLAVFVVIKLVLSQQENHPFIFLVLGAIVAMIYLIKKNMQQPATLPSI